MNEHLDDALRAAEGIVARFEQLGGEGDRDTLVNLVAQGYVRGRIEGLEQGEHALARIGRKS